MLQVFALLEGVHCSRDRLYVVRSVHLYPAQSCYIKYNSVVVLLCTSHVLHIMEDRLLCRLTPPAIEICLYAAAAHVHVHTSSRNSAILSCFHGSSARQHL